MIGILNIHFLTSVLFLAAFGFINWVNQDARYLAPTFKRKYWASIFKVAIPAILLVVTYATFNLEIDNYFTQLYKDSVIKITPEGANFSSSQGNEDLWNFKIIWQFIYTLFFLTVLIIVNNKWLQNTTLKKVTLVLSGLAILVFLTQGLYFLRELQQSYLLQELADYYTISNFNITIRYIAFAFFIGFLAITYRYLKDTFQALNLTVVFDLILHAAILVLVSSELIYWMEMDVLPQADKLGLSILWGLYALLLIGLGIWKQKQHLRIAAMVLFGITLFKLFFYDLSHLETIAKTIVLVSLGLLLLIISFLYNKYKHLITNESEN